MLDILGHLWPQFELLATPGIQIMEIGVWFWIFMVSITLISVVAVIIHRWNCSKRVSRLIKVIATEDKHSLAQNRKALLDKAVDQDPKVTGALWREFDESLVYSSDKTKLSNTLDAEHFFNSKTLAYGLTSSRLLSAAPTFLTAIGVLGTFVGLTLGLKDLQVNADDVDTLKVGVSAMINGAAVAFMTSVWGVGLSLFLNMFEKLFERDALSSIRKLQQKIDYLFPRLPAEQSLVQIATATEESKEALQELHERIGDRLQETVSGMSETMQQAFTDALNNVMAPAIQTLVTNASQQSTDTLQNLVEQFMDGMKAAGMEQGKRMEGAAGDVKLAVDEMSTKMNQLFSQLSEQQNKARENTENSAAEFAQLVERMRLDAERRQASMEQRFNDLIEKMTSTVSGHFDKAKEVDTERADAHAKVQKQLSQDIAQAIEQLSSVSTDQIEAITRAGEEQQSNTNRAFKTTLEDLQKVIAEHTSASDQRESNIQERFQGQMESLISEQQQLLGAIANGAQKTQQQMIEMADQHKSLMLELKSVTGAIETSSQNMQNSSSQLGLLSTNLKQVTDVLDIRLQAVTESLEKASNQNANLAGQVIEQATALKQLQNELAEAAQRFEKAAYSAESGFKLMDQHQKAFLEGISREFQYLGTTLQEQVSGIEKQAEEWLHNYSDTVKNQFEDRMDLWNKSTLQFADQMRVTVSAISGIVDDLEQRK